MSVWGLVVGESREVTRQRGESCDICRSGDAVAVLISSLARKPKTMITQKEFTDIVEGAFGVAFTATAQSAMHDWRRNKPPFLLVPRRISLNKVSQRVMSTGNSDAHHSHHGSTMRCLTCPFVG